MATGISAWAQGIIIAVIVGSIIQMLLPENKNKKYIKVVIGIYILFSILSPIVGKNLSLDDYNFDNYLTIETSEIQDASSTYNESIRSSFKSKVTYNIESQLKSRGYIANNINVEIDDECNILKINISDIYENKKEDEENEDGKIAINKVETNINSVDIDIRERRAKRYGYK